jgi:hypothetical protein
MNDSKGLSESQIFIEPITLDNFEEPVVAPDGWTYDLKQIVDWLKRGNTFFPKTRFPVPQEVVLTPNFTIAQAMLDEKLIDKLPWADAHGFSLGQAPLELNLPYPDALYSSLSPSH